jgi:hypothetical protein
VERSSYDAGRARLLLAAADVVDEVGNLTVFPGEQHVVVVALAAMVALV